MATRTDVRRLAQANADISELALRDLERLWRTLDYGSPLQVRSTLEDVLPDLVAAYGELSATVAADWYDEMRWNAAARGRFSATLASTFDPEAVRANARWAIGPLFAANPDPSAAFGRLSVETDRMTLQPGRTTMRESVRRDPSQPRYARVPAGPAPCAFCRMLASRGAVYASEKTAGLDPDSYHGDCNCVPTPVWPDQPYPEGYEPDVLYEQFAEARTAAGSSDPKAILSKLRELQGTH